MPVDFTIIAGCTLVAAAFGYMVLGSIGAVFAMAAGAYFFMQDQPDPGSGSDEDASDKTRRIQRDLDIEDAKRNKRKQEIAGAELRRRQKIVDDADRKQRAEDREALRRQKIVDDADAAERRRRQRIQDDADEALRRQRVQDDADIALAKAAVLRRTEARRRKSIDPTAENPLDAFDEWLLDTVGTGSWTSTVVFCVAHLAEELTGFRPGDYGIDEFTTMSGVNSASISDYVRNAKHNSDWLDNRFDPKIAKSGPTACPGIGTETGKKLAKEYIHTTRQLLVKFNSFSGLSTKSQYRRR